MNNSAVTGPEVIRSRELAAVALNQMDVDPERAVMWEYSQRFA